MSGNETRNVDKWIAEHVMGWQWWRFDNKGDKWCQLVPPEERWPVIKGEWNGVLSKCQIANMKNYTDLSLFHPSHNRNCALQVLEKCAAKCTVTVEYARNQNGLMQWMVARLDGRRKIESDCKCAETLPLAICLFAKSLFATSPSEPAKASRTAENPPASP